MTAAEDVLAGRPEDSRASLHYALLFAPPERRALLRTLAALYRELHSIALEVSEPAVAGAKLEWWRGELESALRGSGQHPLAPALGRMTAQFGVERERLREMADAVEMELAGGGFANVAELNRYLDKSGGVTAVVAAALSGHDDPATLEAARRLGFAIRRTTLLRDLRSDVLGGRIYLPLDRLEDIGVAPDRILTESAVDALQPVLAELADDAERDYAQGLAALPRKDQRRQRALCVLASLYRALLARMRSDGLRVHETRYALHPARKLWIAWRSAGRAARRRVR